MDSKPANGRETGWRAVVQVLRSPANLIQQLAHDVITTIFPADCRCCGGPLDRAGAVPVCAACVGRLRQSTLPACQRCGEAIDLNLDMEDVRFAGMLAEGSVCRECSLAAPAFTRAVAYGVYDQELRQLIRLLKFSRISAVARLLGGRMADTILTLEGVAANDLLVIAVPLFRQRERQRGYNQSVLLADDAVRRLRTLRPGWKLTPAHRALERRRSTESSFVLSRKGRRRNLSGAFRIRADRQDAVRGREVLLIDDIFTTGATARECARVLVAAGATKVWVATLSRRQNRLVQRQHEDPTELVATWDLAPSAPG